MHRECTYDDLGVGIEVVVVVRASKLADVDVHATVVRPIVRATCGGQCSRLKAANALTESL